MGRFCVARSAFWVSLFSSFVLASSAFAAGPYGSIHVGNWTGGAYTDDKTGAFSHCAAGTPYLSGVFVTLGQNSSGSWLLGFGNERFRLTPGETFPIDLTFDGQAQYHLFGTAVSAVFVTALIPNNSVMNQIRKSHLMVAEAKGATFQFVLNSTGQLLPTIANRVAKLRSGGLANAGDFSIPIAPQVAKPDVQTTATATPPPKSGKKFNMNGTGFVISTSGHILTNNHVISGCVGDIHGNLTGESTVVLRTVSTDETNDLALLQAPNFKDTATLRATPVRSGDAVIAIGYPYHGLLSSDFTVTTGIISSLSGILNDTRYLQISAAVQPGNSGGPLLDNTGNIVGVVAAKINAIKFAKATGDIPENINFAIKTGAVRDFLDNSVVTYQTAEPKAKLETADIARNARAYTVLVSCTATEKN
jgi:S1-C subfamily serine protease